MKQKENNKNQPKQPDKNKKKKWIPKALFTYNKEEDERYDNILAQLDEQIRERTEKEKLLPTWATSDYRNEYDDFYPPYKWRR